MPSNLPPLVEDDEMAWARDRFLPSAVPAVRLARSSTGEPHIGASKWGGSPDLPTDLDWPLWAGDPLDFLVQVRCEEISALPGADALPDRGMLYFFYHAGRQPWGFDPKDRGGAAVLYAEHLAALQPRPVPQGGEPPDVLAPFRIAFSSMDSMPHLFEAEAMFKLTELEACLYGAFHEELVEETWPGYQPQHQLLGHALPEQGDMRRECQLASNGVYCGGPDTDAAAERRLAPGKAEWRLLLQLDSDEEQGVLWGSGGKLYFWIREGDLRARRFERIWAVLQCT